jgi:inorganic triphosphatase YgiF
VKRQTSPQHEAGPGAPQAGTAGWREIELKFEVPADAQRAIEQALRQRAARPQKLQARYHDTAEGSLAARGMSLRLRNEDGRCLQTLKVTDELGPFGRLEHSVDLGPRTRVPRLDPARHAGTPAGEALQIALHGARTPLQERFRTDVLRLACHLESESGDDRVELAFDRGVVQAGDVTQPISELEFELIWGDARALPRLTHEWICGHGLWLNAESKAARGERLRSNPGSTAPAVRAGTPQLARGMSQPALLRAVVGNCLAQAVPNASAVAAGSADPEHVHQLRVGLRRLRTAMRELGNLVPDSGLGACESALAATFRQLGEVRDQQVVLDALKPRLLRAGAQGVAWAQSRPGQIDPGETVRAAPFQCALVQALAFALADAEPPPGAAQDVGRRIRKRLVSLHGKVVRDGPGFPKLSTDAQHSVRKRLKRLRYLSEFVATLYPSAAVQRYLEALRPAQDELGRHNDLVVASLIARTAAQQEDADARFALDWLGAQRKKAEKRSRRAIVRIAAAKPFWVRRGKTPRAPPGP